MKEALLYEKLDAARCCATCCRHGCKIKEGARGLCAVRLNKEGTLYTLVMTR